MSAKAKATIKVTKMSGKVLRVVRLSWHPTGFKAGAIFTCKLKPGRYLFKVYAIDEATNPQTKVGKAVLTVK